MDIVWNRSVDRVMGNSSGRICGWRIDHDQSDEYLVCSRIVDCVACSGDRA